MRALLPRDEADEHSAVLEVRAGTLRVRLLVRGRVVVSASCAQVLEGRRQHSSQQRCSICTSGMCIPSIEEEYRSVDGLPILMTQVCQPQRMAV